MTRLCAIVLLVIGCTDSSSVPCGAVVCPRETVCTTLTSPEEPYCATRAQLAACEGADEGSTCVHPDHDGWCHDGVCLPIVCGNGRTDRSEACDDGDTFDRMGGTCSANCTSTEVCGNGIVDPPEVPGGPGEQCDDGNLVSGDGCTSVCTPEVLHWSQLDTTPPPALVGAALAYDTGRRRVVMFGGTRADGTVTDGTYEWDGDAWARIPSLVTPSARTYAAMAYDASRRRVVLFGGQAHPFNETAALGDTWEWDGHVWRPMLDPVAPSPRTHHGLAYDARRRVVVVFGGQRGETYLGDTWEWNGRAWSRSMASNPPCARSRHVMAFEPTRGRVVVAGGVSDTSCDTDNTFTFDGSVWTRLSASTPELVGAALAFDAVSARLIAYGGETTLGEPVGVTHAFAGDAWSVLGETAPGPRSRAGLVGDPIAGTLVMFGGSVALGANDTPTDETWRWSGSTWSQAPASPLVPPARRFPSSTQDPFTGVSYMFSGLDSNGVALGDLWSFDGTRWRALPATGGPGYAGVGIAYDGARGELVMFGGAPDEASAPSAQTWRWNGQTMTLASPASSPSARIAPAMAYDHRRRRVVLYGGLAPSQSGPVYLDDTWEWDGTTWTEVAIPPSARPPTGVSVSSAYDPVRAMVLLYPRERLADMAVEFEDSVWGFDGTSWIALREPASIPRRVSPYVYLPAQRLTMTFGGFTFGGGTYADAWQWRDGVFELITAAFPPPSRGLHAAFSPREGTDLVVFGGRELLPGDPPDQLLADTWRLRYESAQPREQCLLTVDNDRDGLSGCADPDCWWACTPSCPPGATMCDATAPRCGDSTCNTALETCRSCASDCTCTARCGDSFCDAGETQATCPGDCTPP